MRKGFIVGIDIGGSKMLAVRWDGKRVSKTREFKTPKNLTAFKKVLKNLVWSNSALIGIAAPGRVRRSIFVSATNLPYIRNFDFAKFFGSAKVKINHDANCFARAEYKNKKTTFFLTLGTGIGRAISKGGKILNIKKFEYPARWEKEYKKIRDSYNGIALAIFLAKKLKSIIKIYKIKQVIIGGGVATRKNFASKLEMALGTRVKKSKLDKNSVAIGAALSAA